MIEKARTASAPGKVVLWGEYAVLAGAPAAVMAINRRAHCSITPGESGFSATTSGFTSPPAEITTLFDDHPPLAASLLCASAKQLSEHAFPPLRVHTDTTEFFGADGKLGIGSSAAALVATYGLLASLAGRPIDLSDAIAAHRLTQGGRGSGLDVAAALHGGTIRFANEQASPCSLPASLSFEFYFSGEPSPTHSQLQSFSTWAANDRSQVLNHLVDATDALFSSPGNADAWQNYIRALLQLDRAANLNIFTSTHTALHEAASQLGLAYKPCGAGGGDIGAVVFTDEAQHSARERFAELAAKLGCTRLNLSEDPQGYTEA